MEKPAKNGITYQFGEFRLDSAQRLIFRAGRPVPLAPKVIETLLALVERGGTLVTKDELMARVWPDTFVEEGNLTQMISLLRKALEETGGGQSLIVTVPRQGYRNDFFSANFELPSNLPGCSLSQRKITSTIKPKK